MYFKDSAKNTSIIYKIMFGLMVLALVIIMIWDIVCPYDYLIFVPLAVGIFCVVVIDINISLYAQRKSRDNLEKLRK